MGPSLLVTLHGEVGFCVGVSETVQAPVIRDPVYPGTPSCNGQIATEGEEQSYQQPPTWWLGNNQLICASVGTMYI